MSKMIKLFVFLTCLSVYNVIFAQEKITLSSNAALENSIILLESLRKEFPADSLITWAQQDGRSLILCHVDTTGRIIEIERYRTFKSCVPFLSNYGDKIKNILLNNKTRFVFPCEFTIDGQREREIALQKKSIANIFRQDGYICLQIPIFYIMFPSIFRNIKEKGEHDGIEMTADRCLDVLFERYIPEHY